MFILPSVCLGVHARQRRTSFHHGWLSSPQRPPGVGLSRFNIPFACHPCRKKILRRIRRVADVEAAV
ncbi:hypothetical protein C8Q70DRAFT_950947 [Cubamyces menziesii]|nr:hypothetical protein C8Q70DRAFT_950947 [Cubamyces menziesii]